MYLIMIIVTASYYVMQAWYIKMKAKKKGNFHFLNQQKNVTT